MLAKHQYKTTIFQNSPVLYFCGQKLTPRHQSSWMIARNGGPIVCLTVPHFTMCRSAGDKYCVHKKWDAKHQNVMRLSWKWKNRPYLRNGLTDLRKIWNDDAHWASESDRQLNFQLFNIQDGGRPPSRKSKICYISRTGRPIFAKFDRMTHIVPPNWTGS